MKIVRPLLFVSKYLCKQPYHIEGYRYVKNIEWNWATAFMAPSFPRRLSYQLCFPSVMLYQILKYKFSFSPFFIFFFYAKRYSKRVNTLARPHRAIAHSIVVFFVARVKKWKSKFVHLKVFWDRLSGAPAAIIHCSAHFRFCLKSILCPLLVWRTEHWIW